MDISYRELQKRLKKARSYGYTTIKLNVKKEILIAEYKRCLEKYGQKAQRRQTSPKHTFYINGIDINFCSPQQYLQIFNLRAGATRAQIKKAYFALAKQHHPDCGGDAAI